MKKFCQNAGISLAEMMIALGIVSVGMLGLTKIVEQVTNVGKATENKIGVIEIESFNLKLLKKLIKPSRHEDFNPSLTGRYKESKFESQLINGSFQWPNFTGSIGTFSYDGHNNLVQDISTFLISRIQNNGGQFAKILEGVVLSRCVPGSHSALSKDFKTIYDMPRTLITSGSYKCCETSLTACRDSTDLPMTFVFRKGGVRKLPLIAEYHQVAGFGFSIFFDNAVDVSPMNMIVRTGVLKNKCVSTSVGDKKVCYRYTSQNYDVAKFRATYDYSVFEFSIPVLPELGDTTFLPI